MSLLNRILPLLTWLPKARRAGFLPPDYRARQRRSKAAYQLARRLDLPVATEPNTDADCTALQFQLGRPDNIRFLALDPHLDDVELSNNEVLFVPHSLGANRYITVYSAPYLQLDLDAFTDPRGEWNTRSFKATPAWGRCRVHRSNHPALRVGDLYYGFWPLAAYNRRRVHRVPPGADLAFQDLPDFSGPREWLKLIRLNERPDSLAVDNFEYVKIGLTYACELRDQAYFGADQLVISSASSASGRLIAMCLRRVRPDFRIVGLTSPHRVTELRAASYFDAVYAYDAIASARPAKSLYFDALGREAVTAAVFAHFPVRRWWIYGEGGSRTFLRYLRRNRHGTLYTNLVDSYIYQERHDLSDEELLRITLELIDTYDLERAWYADARLISRSREVFDLYHAYLTNTHTGERVVYRSPLWERG